MNSNSIWQLKETADLELAAALAGNLNISIPAAKLLIQRGISGTDEAKKFLYGNRNDLSLPEELGGIETAVVRIKKAIANHEKIVVFGDYDVDGISSVVLLMDCLTYMGADADFYIPNRFDEGYGLNEAAVRELAGEGCRLLITVDCGSVSFKEVELAMSIGIDVIITDHHTPSAQVPPAVAVINPKLDGNRNNFDLAGVGVAFKLAQALIGNPDEAYRWLDLVALATVADIVPLQGDNRILVKEGLECIRLSSRPGLQALLRESGLENRTVLNSWHIAFILAPRLNSAGRLDKAQTAVNLLLCKDDDTASEIAKQLCDMNNERKNIEEMIYKEAVLKVNNEKDLQRDLVLVLAGEGWHQGVIGIVASRIAEKYHRPTIIISWEGETGKGSGRSQAGFDLFQALDGCRDYLLQYGGHKMAAGLTIKRNDYESFQDSINQMAALTLDDKALLPVRHIDAVLQPEDISFQFYDELCLFEPYGEGNPAPMFLLKNVEVKNYKLVGKNEAHLKFKTEPDDMDCIAFGHPEWASGLCNCYQDIVFAIDRNEFQGKVNLQLQIKDLRPSFQVSKRKHVAVPDRRLDIIKKTLAELKDNRPVIYLYPTFRSLKMHAMLVKNIFPSGYVTELHGKIPPGLRLEKQYDLTRGKSSVYLITMAYYKYFMQKHALPDSLHYTVSLVTQDDESEVWLDKGKDFELLPPIADWSYQEQKTVIYSNRRQTIRMLSDAIKNIIIETGKNAHERVELRKNFSNSGAGAFIIDGLYPSMHTSFKDINELVFADLPFSSYEADLVREQIAAADDFKNTVLFTREHVVSNKHYLNRQYPNKETIKNFLIFLSHLNKSLIRADINELCTQIGEHIGKEFSTLDLFPVLQILSELGLCESRKKGSIIEIKCFKAQSSVVDVSESPYYLEGLAEKNEFARWEHHLSSFWNGNDRSGNYNK